MTGGYEGFFFVCTWRTVKIAMNQVNARVEDSRAQGHTFSS